MRSVTSSAAKRSGDIGSFRRRVRSQHRRGAGQGRARQAFRDRARHRGRGGGAGRLGGDQPAAARPRHVQVPRPGAEGISTASPRLLSSEHGKTFADAKGDIQRGLEVVEFACGIPHLLKGEYTDGAGPGIDLYSMRQPLGVVAGITPFNFPAMIPMWKFAPAIACGNAFILKPSERDPSVPMRLGELMIEAGLPPGILNVVNGDKEAVDTISTIRASWRSASSAPSAIAEYVYATGCANGKRVQCFGGAKNHMIVMPDADLDQAVDALIGAGYGSAGERCMAMSVAVPVGAKTADLADGKAGAAGGEPEDRALQRRAGRLRARGDARHLDKVKGYVDLGVKEGAKLLVDGRSSSCRVTRTATCVQRPPTRRSTVTSPSLASWVCLPVAAHRMPSVDPRCRYSRSSVGSPSEPNRGSSEVRSGSIAVSASAKCSSGGRSSVFGSSLRSELL